MPSLYEIGGLRASEPAAEIPRAARDPEPVHARCGLVGGAGLEPAASSL